MYATINLQNLVKILDGVSEECWRSIHEHTRVLNTIIIVSLLNILLKRFNIQGDSKPLRQTLRVDRVNNKEHFLLNNLCLLKRRVVSKLPLIFVNLL